MIAGLTLLLGGLLLAVAELRSRGRMKMIGRRPRSLARLFPDLALLTAIALLFIDLSPAEERTSFGPSPSIVLAVDVSSSMAAEDQLPSRLGRSREEIRALLSALPEARFALLPFAGSAVVQTPLTRDHQALSFFVERLTVETVNAPGSGPAEALSAAAKLLESEPGAKAIVLFSDGERTLDVPPPPLPAEIPVYAVPLGTTAGAPLTDGEGRPRRDARGRPLVTRLDPDNLRRLTEGTGGTLLGPESGAAADALAERWPTEFPADERSAPHFPLAAAFSLLLLRQAIGRLSASRQTVALGLCFLLLGACGTDRTPTGYGHFRKGLREADGDKAVAADHFARAAAVLDGRERAAALYNLGTLLLRSASPARAIPYLEEALLLQPGDEAIRFNLALALRTAGSSPEEPAAARGEEDSGEEQAPGGMSRERARRLVEQIRPEPFAPPAPPHATVRETLPRRDW